jgi:hypothetical protein
MTLLIGTETPHEISVSSVAKRGSTRCDRGAKHRLDGAGQTDDVGFLQGLGASKRREFRCEADLVGINVADATHLVLVEQERL